MRSGSRRATVMCQACGASSTICCATVKLCPRVHSGSIANGSAAVDERGLEPRARPQRLRQREPRVGERHQLAARACARRSACALRAEPPDLAPVAGQQLGQHGRVARRWNSASPRGRRRESRTTRAERPPRTPRTCPRRGPSGRTTARPRAPPPGRAAGRRAALRRRAGPRWRAPRARGAAARRSPGATSSVDGAWLRACAHGRASRRRAVRALRPARRLRQSSPLAALVAALERGRGGVEVGEQLRGLLGGRRAAAAAPRPARGRGVRARPGLSARPRGGRGRRPAPAATNDRSARAARPRLRRER